MTNTSYRRDDNAQDQVRDLFAAAKWRVRTHPDVDFVVRKGSVMYAVEIKAASEARADRLIPLTAQALLEIRTAVRQMGSKVSPLVIIVAPRMRAGVMRQVERFVQLHAPEVAIGLVDPDGHRRFVGRGLDALNREASAEHHRLEEPMVDLFSDLNQWLFKVMLAPYLGNPALLHAPVREYRNASELARAASVGTMTAARFVRQLRREGFLDESGETLRIVRLEEALRRWQASRQRPVTDIPARWILRRKPQESIRRALSAAGDRACLALYAAADALHLGFVHGGPTHIFMREISSKLLSDMGLIKAAAGQSGDVYLRVPSAKESVFRAAVEVDGMKAADVLQIWLDVSHHPVRGREQAQLLHGRVLRPMIERAEKHAIR